MRFFLFIICCCSALFGARAFVFDEYIDRSAAAAADRFVEAIDGDTAYFVLRSTGGEFQEVFHIARRLHELKNVTKVVYIERAIGAPALLPLIADAIYVAPDAMWGDMSRGSHLSKKRLLSSASALIEKQKERALYSRIAESMIDPYAQIASMPHQEGEPLILSAAQMEQLAITTEPVEKRAFLDSFALTTVSASGVVARVRDVVSAEELEEEFREQIHLEKDAENRIGYVVLEREAPINQSTYIHMKFAIEHFREIGCRAIVLRLNTPGGEVFSSLKIAELLQKTDVDHNIPVIAFIDNWAVSAGALLAYACRYIVSGETAIMGAAQPVIMKEGGAEAASEKMTSALRAEFANVAIFWGRNADIAEAMVDQDIVLVLRDHEIVRLHDESELITSGLDQDTIISRRGKLLTLNAQELYNYGVSSALLPRDARTTITDEQLQKGRWPASQSAVFTLPYLRAFPNTEMVAYSDWRTSFFAFLTHPSVASILFFAMMIGFYLEFNSPGFGVFGSLGVLCLGLILMSSFAVYTVGWIELLLLGLGALLLMIELFVIPGFGLPGIVGIAFMLIGLIALMLPSIDGVDLFDPQSMHVIFHALIHRLAWILAGLISAFVFIAIMARFFSHKVLNLTRLVLRGEQNKELGYSAFLPEAMPELGVEGVAYTTLQPSGRVLIGGNTYDAVSESGFIDRGERLVIVGIEGKRVIVRRKESSPL